MPSGLVTVTCGASGPIARALGSSGTGCRLWAAALVEETLAGVKVMVTVTVLLQLPGEVAVVVTEMVTVSARASAAAHRIFVMLLVLVARLA